MREEIIGVTMDTICKRANGDMKIIPECVADSEIQNFYAGKTVFLTGSTGFMGKCLVEKLLRGCPKLKRIYVMVRPKKGLSAEERINKYLGDVLFNTVRQMYSDFSSKIHLVEGDLMLDGMALSEKDKITMIDEVNIIFHNASNVKFNTRMSTALKINVLGTKEMLDFAEQCKHIEGFLYVSTAYSHCYHKNIMEEAYPSPADLKMVQDLIAADLASPTGISDAILPDILGKFPNTYTFTKAIAEGLVNDAGKQASFPCIVYRPSIVISTWKEPLKGWVGNLNGPAMLLIGYGLGVIHVVYKGDAALDFIPVDMSINSMLVLMWHAVKNRINERPLVYNYGCSSLKPMTIKRLKDLTPTQSDGSFLYPSVHQIWHIFAIFTDNLFVFVTLCVLFLGIPAIFTDLYLLLKGKKPQALSVFLKVSLSWRAILYFLAGEWRIDISEMNKVVDRMSPVDRDLFFCDVRELDWIDYCKTYAAGLRLYGVKEPMSTLPAARRKAILLRRIHNTITYTLILLIVYIFATKLGLF